MEKEKSVDSRQYFKVKTFFVFLLLANVSTELTSCLTLLYYMI